MKTKQCIIYGVTSLIYFYAQHSSAAIALDRTRVIFNGSGKSTSVAVYNNNKQSPYLAMAWLEDEYGNKATDKFAVLPPIQRIEATGKGSIKIQALPSVLSLPKDREYLLYFNLREIPPKSTKENALQIALQTRVKFIYRPANLEIKTNDINWVNSISLSMKNGMVGINNPSGYYLSLINLSSNGSVNKKISPVMVPPKSNDFLSLNGTNLGKNPVITYIDDYGAHPKIKFNCTATQCVVAKIERS
jgi:P pilus assembly chaperone PapD